MAELPINYGDSGRIARDKINDSFDALVEQVEGYEPHIVDGIWWIGETNTGVKAEGDNVQMKVEGDYIRYKTDSISWTTLILLSDLKGPQGDQGDAATITVGSTVTGAAGTSASVENVGSSSEAVLKFVIPAGAKGDPGEDGEDGEDGESATIEIGTTTTGEPGTDASVTNSGTSSAAVLNFTIPAGLKGDPGEDGEDGNGISSVTATKSGKTTTVTMNFDEGDPFSFQVQDGADGQGSGDVLGPSSSTDGNVVLFDGTTGKLIKDSGKTIPTQASDVNALPSSTKYGASLTVSIDSDYKVTTTLKDQDGNTLGTAQVIDLPLESVVVGGSYDDQTKKVILTLQNGNTIEFSVADLVSGLQSEITSNNKLSADLVDDTSTTNKFVTANDKSTWNGKQDALTTQTAYTEKGTTTKVPQISTNTLGQVTSISEQNIAFPVTSVNGSTGAVTGLQTTSNLKTSLTDNSDSYYPSQKAVKTAVDSKQDTLVNQTNIKSINGNSLLGSGDLTIAAGVTSVNGNTGAVTVNEVPSSGTTDYVLTKTANGYGWAAPAAGGITNDTTGTTTTVTKIWAGTEAEYALITPASDTIYYVF